MWLNAPFLDVIMCNDGMPPFKKFVPTYGNALESPFRISG